jgi:hypothetical protein
MKLRAIVTAVMIALTTPAFADISDYESMHRRLADVLGSRAQADAAYDMTRISCAVSIIRKPNGSSPRQPAPAGCWCSTTRSAVASWAASIAHLGPRPSR